MIKRASKREMHEREQEIIQLIAIGFSRAEISEQLAPKFKVSPKSVQHQYDRLIADWIKLDKDKIDEAKANYMMRLDGLYMKAVKLNQIKTASDIVEKQAKMMGIYNPKAQTPEAAPTINIVPKQGLTVVPLKAENED